MTDTGDSYLAKGLDIEAALVNGLPSLRLIFTVSGGVQVAVVLLRPAFRDITTQMALCMQQAMALDGLEE